MTIFKKTPNLICSYCGKKFYRPLCRLRKGQIIMYCNKSCKMKAEVKKQQIKCFCHNCGQEMSRSPSGFMKNGKLSQDIFCSRKCFGLHLRQFTGEKAFAWKGGYKKDERNRIRARKFWKDLREEVLKIFDNVCAICKIQGNLHVHHIIPWRIGGKDNIDNLISLCPQCHSKKTVKDWEAENNQNWKEYGAHMCRFPKEVM